MKRTENQIFKFFWPKNQQKKNWIFHIHLIQKPTETIKFTSLPLLNTKTIPCNQIYAHPVAQNLIKHKKIQNLQLWNTKHQYPYGETESKTKLYIYLTQNPTKEWILSQ